MIISELKITQKWKQFYVIVVKVFAVKCFKFDYESHFSKTFECWFLTQELKYCKYMDQIVLMIFDSCFNPFGVKYPISYYSCAVDFVLFYESQ